MASLVGSWHLLTMVPPGEGGVSTPNGGGGGGRVIRNRLPLRTSLVLGEYIIGR